MSEPDSRSEHVDVAVIGGGPAGAVAALCSARAGLSTVIVERQTECRTSVVGESLAPSATPLLERLELLPAFLATQPLPCYANRSSWGGDGRLTDYDFIRDPRGHGWHVDRRRFEQMLLDSARAAGACLRTGIALREARRTDDGGWSLELGGSDDPSEIRASFVIDASGRAAAFARRAGVRRVHFDRLVAATAFMEPASAPCVDSTTLVEAVPSGWWYSALLPDGQLAAAFMTDPDELKAFGLWRTEGWLAMLSAAPETRRRVETNGYRLASRPCISAAGTSYLERVTGEGWLAAGDAAACYDPLSSHGIGTAIATGAQAARAAAARLAGDARALPEYVASVTRGFERYLRLWRPYYAQETRWPSAPFWSRRRLAPVDAPSALTAV